MGRPQFSQAGTNPPGSAGGEPQTVATMDRPELVTVEQRNTTSLAAGNSERIEVYAPSGSLYNVVAMVFQAPADPDWTSGSHDVMVWSADHATVMKGSSTYTDDIRYRYGYFQQVGNANPPDSDAQGKIVDLLKAGPNEPIVFRYKNDADAAQSYDRVVQVVLEEVHY